MWGFYSNFHITNVSTELMTFFQFQRGSTCNENHNTVTISYWTCVWQTTTWLITPWVVLTRRQRVSEHKTEWTDISFFLFSLSKSIVSLWAEQAGGNGEVIKCALVWAEETEEEEEGGKDITTKREERERKREEKWIERRGNRKRERGKRAGRIEERKRKRKEDGI